MLRTRMLGLAAAAAAAGSSVCASAQQSSLESDAIAFGTRETVRNMDLSPDGSRAVFVGAGPGRTSITYVADIGAGTTKPILYSKGDPETLHWCNFVSNAALACRYVSLTVADGTGYAPVGAIVPNYRMISLDLEGKNIKSLGQRASGFEIGLRQSDGDIIDWLPNEPGDHVLMTRHYIPEGAGDNASNARKTRRGVGVVKLNVKNLSADIIEKPRDNVVHWMSDGRGTVRLLGIAEISAESFPTGRVKYLYRANGSKEWRKLSDYRDEEEFQPLAIDASSNALYALRKWKGRLALSRSTLEDSVSESIVAQHPRVDIDDVVRSGDGQHVIGYTYAEDYRHAVYFDPEYKGLAASLSKALPNQPIVDFVKTSEDGKKVLIFAGSDRDPGRYYLLDRSTKSMGELMPVRPALASRTLAEVKPVTYKAADGTVIPAYLTLPPGKEAKGLPAVVLPHGGPSARDQWGFDWLSQFLAARGYVVIQPQYRGSAGFGDAWLVQNGFKSWQTSIGDVTAAARHLATEGIADPNRLAIVGWSYGGYAALQAAATEPSLFKAVAAIAPVTDLALLKTDSEDYSSRLVVADFIGSGPHVSEGSPLRRARSIAAPVLLVHGGLDLNVRAHHSRRMHDALQGLGKSSELVAFDGLDHQLEDSQARALMLTKIGQLLERTIGR